MATRPRPLAAAAAVAVLALACGAGAELPLELRFDGHPFAPTAPPDISCFSVTRGSWVSCRVQKGEARGEYLLEPLAPGPYRMHVSIDENPANPRRYPGDYEAQLMFEVTATGPERLIVDLPRLIHLTRPGDNGRSLEGMLTGGCAKQPRFETPRYAWTPVAAVGFAWEPIVDGAEYRYSIAAVSCDQRSAERQVLSTTTGAAAVTLVLPPNADGEYYLFRLGAWKDGRIVGDLYTHDSGAHSWNYRFLVRDASVPRWAYAAAGGVLFLLFLGAWRTFVGVEPVRRRRHARIVAGVAVAVIAVGAAAGAAYHYRQDGERRRAEAAQAEVEAARQARQRNFIAAFVSAAPRPAWWDEVTTPYLIDNVGDLLSAWQGHASGAAGDRQFFKAAYQGIVDHPDDEHVVATAIDLMFWVERDYPQRLAMARFGYERYFTHRRRTDNCANCMVGDTTQALTQNLSQLMMEAGRYDEAIEVGRRLIEARGAEVSPYKLAETWDRMAWAHWRKGERERAFAIVREALARYGTSTRGDVLRSTLAQFERERPPAPVPK